MAIFLIGFNLGWTLVLTVYASYMFSLNQRAWDKNIEAWEDHMKHRHAS